MTISLFPAASVSVFFLLLPISQASIPPVSKLVSIAELGHLKVGRSIADYPLISKDRQRFCAQGRKARVTVFLFHSALPKRCLNLECGTFAKQVIARNGIVVGGTHEDYLREAGLLTEAPHTREGVKPESVLFVADGEGKVTAIYRDAGPGDVAEVLRGMP